MKRIARGLCLCASLALFWACGEGDLLGTITPRVREGGTRIWEVSAEDLPSAFDVISGRRLFLGSGDINASTGDFFVDGAPGATELRLRSLASLLRAESSHQVEIQDLGEVDFEDLSEAPEDGYLDAEDTTGVAIVTGHVYALEIGRGDLSPNFAKLVVDVVGATGESPDRQFIEFRYALQVQPGNRSFEED